MFRFTQIKFKTISNNTLEKIPFEINENDLHISFDLQLRPNLMS